MQINNEVARITYLPESRLFAWLDQFYVNEIDWYANGNPHDLTPAGIVADIEADNIDPLDIDQGHLEDHQLTPLWSDLGYPLPSDADEMSHPFHWNTPSDMVRESLKEYANMFDIEPVAERVLNRLRNEYDREQQNV